MSYRYLEHATDAFIEVEAASLEEAFVVAAKSVVETILDVDLIEEKKERQISVSGKDLNYLLYNWLEEMIILTITEGFASKSLKVRLEKNQEYKITADIRGEDVDIKKHHFKVEIKSPTFHLMEIKQNGRILMRYLLDL
ncbi:MAG TPA: archease [Candidatus Nitrosotenuis sp.]|nr:archease [Candidatus Nitrosotenuis sp.]